MAQGPGRYDDAATEARKTTGGRAVVLIVVDGEHGSGFTVQFVGTEAEGESFAQGLPDLLRSVAREIETDRAAKRSDV